MSGVRNKDMKGWISVHRQLQDHWLWKEKPFDKRSAWIDMLLLANHDNNKFLLGNELLEVEKGSFITSELKLMERWGWSKSKLRNFLDLLEKDKMIIKKSDKKKTNICIENYSNYQSLQTTERPQEDHKKTTERPQEDTNNNVNNANKENNIDYVSVFNYYMTLNLIKHKTYTNAMTNAIKKAMTDNKYDIEYCKVLLKRHETVVEKTKNAQFPIKARGITEFFGQKVYNATHLICSEYEEGGKHYEDYIKPKNITRIGIPKCESVLGKREERWM